MKIMMNMLFTESQREQWMGRSGSLSMLLAKVFSREWDVTTESPKVLQPRKH